MAEYNSSGTLLRRYAHGLGAGDDPQVWFEGSSVADSARRYLYADERGSIIAVTNSTGSVLNRNTYDEYGIPGSSNDGRFQYTGQAWLPELGMFYYKARMYSPTLGRFMQTDPIGYGDGMNMYAYVRNDPVNGVDPSGLVTACVVDSTGSYCSSDSDDWVGFDGMSPGASGFSGMTVGWWDTSRAPKAKIPEPQNDVCDAPVVTVGLGGAVTGLVGSNFLQSENGFDLGVSIQIHIPTAFDLSNPFAGLQASFTLSDSKLSGSGAYVGAGANVVGGYGPAPASGFSTNSSRGFGGGLGRGPSASSVFSYSGGEGANTTGGTGAVGVRPGVGVGAYAAVYDTTNYNLATARLGC